MDLLLGDDQSLVVVNTCGEINSTESVIVSQLRKYLSIAEVFTNFNVGIGNFLITIFLSLIVSPA